MVQRSRSKLVAARLVENPTAQLAANRRWMLKSIWIYVRYCTVGGRKGNGVARVKVQATTEFHGLDLPNEIPTSTHEYVDVGEKLYQTNQIPRGTKHEQSEIQLQHWLRH